VRAMSSGSHSAKDRPGADDLRERARATWQVVWVPVFPFVLGGLFYLWGKRNVPHDFMEICCQVLAVVILAVAVQTRLLWDERFDTVDDRMFGRAVAAMLLLGEAAPLAALLAGTDSVILGVPAAFAIVMGLLFIVLHGVVGDPRLPPGERECELTDTAHNSTTSGSKDSSVRMMSAELINPKLK
jgi:hypothetical protein